MKNPGIIKEIDKLGRIVIPKEFRERFGLLDKVELTLTKEGVLISSIDYELVERCYLSDVVVDHSEK